MQDIAPFSYQHTRYSIKAHDISFFFKNKNKTNHTFMQAERKLNQNTYDKKKKKSISFYKTVQTGLNHSFNCPIKYGP